jgi:hypothetical protein
MIAQAMTQLVYILQRNISAHHKLKVSSSMQLSSLCYQIAAAKKKQVAAAAGT